MAQLANISLKNAAAVEQAYVATPGTTPNSVTWYNGTASWAARFKAWLTHTLAPANSTTGFNKITVGHSVPVVNATTGVLEHTIQYKLEVTQSVKAIQSERDEAYARFVDLLADTVVSNALKSYDMPY